ncbi:hypothetical protein ZHAS_00004989 [Anopheles sinensis]|uniref:Uncharacterized protein n=1 Tax=Anopheles sinensis TaxID=74873 RepID=A0A084VIM7_ANOSI|nr:hypothetical protein ZHAS_00004989 [Anopheles sinensis]
MPPKVCGSSIWPAGSIGFMPPGVRFPHPPFSQDEPMRSALVFLPTTTPGDHRVPAWNDSALLICSLLDVGRTVLMKMMKFMMLIAISLPPKGKLGIFVMAGM